MSNRPTKKVLIVLGMHRSGSSMITRMLNLHGAELIGEISQPNDYNERGYWESTEIQRLNDEILSFERSAWFDWHTFPLASIPPNKRNYFEGKITRFLIDHVVPEKAPLFVIKDPRICKIFPIWQSALRAAGVRASVVIPFRHPIEVAASLAHRDDLSRSWGFLLWLRHVLDAERFSRDYPRVFLSFENSMLNWQSTFQDMEKLLQLKWPVASTSIKAEVRAFLSPGLKHHLWSPSDLDPIGGLSHRTHELFEMLKKVELSKEHGALQASFDAAHAELELFSKPIEENVPRVIRTVLAYEKKLQLIDEQELIDRKNFLALRTSGSDRMAHLFTLKDEVETVSSKLSKEKAAREIQNMKMSEMTSSLKQTNQEFVNQKKRLRSADEDYEQAKSKWRTEQSILKSKLENTTTELLLMKDELAKHLAEQVEWLETEKALEARLLEQGALAGILGKEKRKLKRALSETEANAGKTLKKLAEKNECLANLLAKTQLQSNQLDQQRLQLIDRDHHARNTQGELNEVKEKVQQFQQTVGELENDNQEHTISLIKRFEEITQLTRLLETRSEPSTTIIPALARRPAQELAAKLRNVTRNSREKRLAKLIEETDYFDGEWYLHQYPDVRDDGLSPALHYIRYGTKEGRNPGPAFNSYAYLLANPDVALENINPLVHFIQFGLEEGRTISSHASKLKTQP